MLYHHQLQNTTRIFHIYFGYTKTYYIRTQLTTLKIKGLRIILTFF